MTTKAKTKSKLNISPINIGLGANDREKVCELLSGVLADQHVLYIKTRNFHWNLVGERFHTLHAFYEEQYNVLALAIDETAERMRMLGGVSPGSMKQFLADATLKEEKGALVDGEHTINALTKDHEKCAQKLRQDIDLCADKYGDAGTADFLTALLQKHEQAAWMLRSFLV